MHTCPKCGQGYYSNDDIDDQRTASTSASRKRTMTELHPLDAGLADIGVPPSGLPFPPDSWKIIRLWGLGYVLISKTGLRAIIDCSKKDDNNFWVHISVSRSNRTPSHEEMASVKRDFLGDRYAYSVWPPQSQYVNIHAYCLHLWARVDTGDGRVLPEFSSELDGIGVSI